MRKFAFTNLTSPSGGKSRGQSLLELALVLPVLILILLGLVEVSIFIGRYLDALDLTREAARFASVRNPFTSIDTPITGPGDDVNSDGRRDPDCSDPNQFFFYYQTACVFSPPTNPACVAADDPFCNGMNPYLDLNLETDDVLISVYTVEGDNDVSNVHPTTTISDTRLRGSSFSDTGGQTSFYWALSDHDVDTSHNANWSKDCNGNVVPGKIPYYSLTRVQNIIDTTSINDSSGSPVYSPGSKGFVAVEIYYCYTQALGLPVFTTFVPNPLMIHAYTLMPLPDAAPTPTPPTSP
jgi:hypothetical protein